MKGKRLNSALIGLLVLGLVVPTGAAAPTLIDSVFESNELILRPYDGPNGQTYVSSVEDTRPGHEGEQNITIDMSKINLEAKTEVENVFVIANEGDELLTVWVTHDATQYLTIERSDTGQSIQGQENRVNLSPGESINVGFSIDTENSDLSEDDLLLETISLHAGEFGSDAPPPATPTPNETETATPTATPNETETATPTETPVETETATSTETPVETPENDSDITIEEVDEVPTGEEGPPEAVIESQDNQTVDVGLNQSELNDVFGQEQSDSIQQSLQSAGAQAVTDVGRPITLSGSPSLVRSSQAVDGEGQIVQAWDITIPENRRNETQTLRLQVNRSKFPPGSDPANARIGHYTGDGWQLLDTRVIRTTDTVVTFEVKTRTFSPFALFAENNVKHEWTLPNGTVVEGVNIRTVFDEIGIYNVTLTITDAFGQSDSTDYRILVNDPPQPTIEVEGDREPGEPIRLHANVTNEIGEITDIVWLFEDGTRVFNQTVTVKFGQGRYSIRVLARDTYGSIGRTSTQLQIGGTVPQGQSEPTAPGVPNAGAIVLVGLGAAFTFLSGRWAYPGNLAMLRPVAPRVSVLREPKWADGVIRIQKLRVEDPNGDLERVLITVYDPADNALLEKEIELEATHSYEASPERIHAPMLRGEDLSAGYEIEVQGFDEKDHSSRRERQPIVG